MEGKSLKSLFLYKRKPVQKETDAKGEGAAKGKEGKFLRKCFLHHAQFLIGSAIAVRTRCNCNEENV